MQDLRATTEAMTLDLLEKGEAFEVVGVTQGGEIGMRLVEMGFVPGSRGVFVRNSLLGDPMQVEILGYSLSLRRSEAELIRVRRMESHE